MWKLYNTKRTLPSAVPLIFSSPAHVPSTTEAYLTLPDSNNGNSSFIRGDKLKLEDFTYFYLFDLLTSFSPIIAKNRKFKDIMEILMGQPFYRRIGRRSLDNELKLDVITALDDTRCYTFLLTRAWTWSNLSKGVMYGSYSDNTPVFILPTVSLDTYNKLRKLSSNNSGSRKRKVGVEEFLYSITFNIAGTFPFSTFPTLLCKIIRKLTGEKEWVTAKLISRDYIHNMYLTFSISSVIPEFSYDKAVKRRYVDSALQSLIKQYSEKYPVPQATEPIGLDEIVDAVEEIAASRRIPKPKLASTNPADDELDDLFDTSRPTPGTGTVLIVNEDLVSWINTISENRLHVSADMSTYTDTQDGTTDNP
jgi:hypothetical protein